MNRQHMRFARVLVAARAPFGCHFSHFLVFYGVFAYPSPKTSYPSSKTSNRSPKTSNPSLVECGKGRILRHFGDLGCRKARILRRFGRVELLSCDVFSTFLAVFG